MESVVQSVDRELLDCFGAPPFWLIFKLAWLQEGARGYTEESRAAGYAKNLLDFFLIFLNYHNTSLV